VVAVRGDDLSENWLTDGASVGTGLRGSWS